jgi:hypothetical protein
MRTTRREAHICRTNMYMIAAGIFANRCGSSNPKLMLAVWCWRLEYSRRFRQPIMQQCGGGNTFCSSAKMERQGNAGEALGLEFLKISIELRQYCGDIGARIQDFYQRSWRYTVHWPMNNHGWIVRRAWERRRLNWSIARSACTAPHCTGHGK